MHARLAFMVESVVSERKALKQYRLYPTQVNWVIELRGKCAIVEKIIRKYPKVKIVSQGGFSFLSKSLI